PVLATARHCIFIISAYMNAVARDRAADRGCTGGGEVADDVGPPGEIPRGFLIWTMAIGLSAFFARFVQPGFEAGQILFAFRPQLALKRLTGELCLIGLPRVALDFLQAPVAADGSDLMHAAAGIGEPLACRLAQAVRGAADQASGAAALA